MTDTKNAPKKQHSPAKRSPVFAAQCFLGAAVVSTIATFSYISYIDEPQAAVSADERISLSQSVSLEDIMRLAQAQRFTSGRTGNYLAGRYAANTGDFESANLFLTRTLRLDPENAEIAGYAYRMRLITGDMDDAAAMAKQLYEAGDVESNPEIMMLLSYVKAGEYAKARDVLQTFHEGGFNVIILPLLTAWVDYAEGKLDKPIKQDIVVQQVAEFAPFIYYQSALLNDLAGFEEEALMQYNEALALSKAMPYRVVEMLGNLHARRGEWDKAKALYDRYRADNPDSILLASDEVLMEAQGKAPARLIQSPREGIAEIFFSTASILHNEELNEEALIYIQQVLYLSPDFVAARLMRGTIYEDLERYEEAIAEYESLPHGSPYYYKAQLRKAYTLNAMGRSDEALELLSGLESDLPQSYQLQLTRGDILMRVKKFEQAAEAYTQALKHVEKVDAEHWPIFYARGISYERADEWKKAEGDFLKALEIEPGQPDVMNYLGYSWLTQKMRLTEARGLIEQAVQARPSDAHIVDSMGWALYALGDYKGAIEYLERAIELMPTDPTVNDHLGDAYWRMGRKTEARFQWKRALMFKPEPEHAETLSQKLSNGLPPAEQLQTAENDKKHVEVRRN